jgi:sterol desaturase/sphingolipid hydroxylase (fatty acid hydroxylase superfamily)
MPLAVISPLVIVGWAVTLTLLERLFPYLPGYRILRPDFWTDLVMYTLVQSYVLALIISLIIDLIDSSTGLSRLNLVSGWPLLGQWLFFLVTHDFWQYWFHRLQHRNRWLWRTHEAAHAPLHVDWLAGSRSHALEILIAQTVEFAPLVLLGASPSLPLLKGLTDAVWGMHNHANIDVRFGPLLYLINGPQLHRWHHDLDVPRPGVNFATKIALWDWIFGTAYFPRDRKPARYGLRDSSRWPHGNYWRQFIHAFRRIGDRRRAATARNAECAISRPAAPEAVISPPGSPACRARRLPSSAPCPRATAAPSRWPARPP